MNIAHTPGPWSVFNDHPDEDTKPNIGYIRPSSQVDRYDDTEIATIYLFADKERAANARLIAAAPEMLQALRRAVLALAFSAETSPAMRDDYNAVRAAIAKATGA